MLTEIKPFLPLWWLTAVQAVGLLSAWYARVHQGSHRQSSSQWAFLLSMALVGVTTMAASLTSPAGSVTCGTTLSVMVLAAVWDFDKGRKRVAR